MKKFDLDFVRSNFPAFSEPSLAGWGFFENAGGSYACRQVIDRLHAYYTKTKVQPYGFFPASVKAGNEMDSARTRMAAMLNVEPDEVHFGPSTSQNTYVVAQALRKHLHPGDEIIVTNQDHEANIGVWSRLGDEGFVVREWQVDPETAELDGAGLDALLNDRTKVVAFTHCSNIVGTTNPVREWVDKIHAAGAIAMVDGVSFCGHGLPDIAALGADMYTFSLYKVYGPHLGVMTMRSDVVDKLPNQGHFFNAPYRTKKMTPAGPDHAQIAAVNGVLDYFDDVHAHHAGDNAAPVERSKALRKLFHDRETELLQPLLDFLDGHPRARLVGKTNAELRAPTVTLTVPGKKPDDIAKALAGDKLGVGAGHFYAYRLIDALGIDTDEGVLRLSFVHYTSQDDVARLIDSLDRNL